jgi:DNA-binding transcriptional LysR family regulator
MRLHLDLSSVEAFILVADLRSFTHAADALGLTQAGVSLKLRRLEETVGRRLLDRTPRQVRLSADGEAFLPHARTLMAAQDLALMTSNEPERELTIAISDHVAGPELPDILARLNAYDPGLMLKVRVDYSRKVLADFDHGEVDVAVVRHEGRRRDGEVLFEDGYGWFASMSARFEGKSLPLITVTESCGVREVAMRLLTQAKVRWVDAFLGGGVATAMSAANSGIGVLPLPRRLATTGLIEVGEPLGLPPFPSAKVTMHTRRVDGHTKATLRVLSSAFRSASSRG